MAKRGALTVEVTVSSFSSYVAFLEGYARALIAAETQWDRARAWLRDAVRSARAGDPLRARRLAARRRSPSLSRRVRSERDVSRLAQEVFALPARLAAERKRKVVVALDEFQAIGGFNGGSVEHAMRAAVQHQREVGYVFAGSEPSLMERMLGPKRPFYKAGPVMRLEKIPADEFAAFIDARFTRSGMRPEAGPRRRRRRARRQPAVRRAAPRARNLGRGARRRHGDARRSTICTRRCAPARRAADDVRSGLAAADARAARACCARSCSRKAASCCRPTSARGIGWAAPSTVQSALAALLRDDLIGRDGDRYVVVDSLLREWVARRTF